MPEIKLENVNKTYNPGLFKKKVHAVSNLSLSVNQGEVYGLIGPNGAGKSSAIRLMLGLSRPDSGMIYYRGKSLLERDVRTDLGYLPENPYLYDHLSLSELLRFSARVCDMPTALFTTRSQYLLERLLLAADAKRPLRTFSKGMKQRAGLCFALLHDPAIVILDEPMSGLDPHGRKLVFDLICELRDAGKTIFFCSHILSDVERLCDAVGLLVRGGLVKSISASELRNVKNQRIHLVVSSLSSEQKEILQQRDCSITWTENQLVVSISNEQHIEVVHQLHHWGIAILGSRSEQTTLENLFLEYCVQGDR